MLRHSTEQLRVAYRGRFWVDASSYDLVELVMTAEDLPLHWDVRAVDRTLRYTRAPIGSQDFVLPDRAILLTTLPDGNKVRTDTRFDNCRQYTAQSFLHFPAEGQSNTPGTQKSNHSRVPLPHDFIVELRLETEIDSDHAAIGDPIEATLQTETGKRRKVPIGRNSVLHGRINRMEVLDGDRHVDIVFNYLDINGAKIDIRSRRNQLVSKSKSGWLPAPIRATGRRIHFQRGHLLLFRSTAPGGG